MTQWRVVTDAEGLSTALKDGAPQIEIKGEISGSPMITLGPGVSLRGGTLVFKAKGVRLTSDNTLEDVSIETRDTEVAILNDPGDDVVTVEIEGDVNEIAVAGAIVAEGKNSDAAHVKGDGPDLYRIEVSSSDGTDLVRN